MFYLPPGSMMQLYDGRVVRKDEKTKQWQDNMGVPISEQQMQFMMQFPSYGGDDPSNGGSENWTLAFSRLFGSIGVAQASTETLNANNTLIIGRNILPQNLRVDFASGGTYQGVAGVIFSVYKNNVGVTAIGITKTVPPSLSIGSFNDGDLLKFSMISPTGNTFDFNAAVIGTPGVVPPSQKALGSFRVFSNF